MSMWWWIPLGIAGAGAVAVTLINRALAREVDALHRALRPVAVARRREVPRGSSRS